MDAFVAKHKAIPLRTWIVDVTRPASKICGDALPSNKPLYPNEFSEIGRRSGSCAGILRRLSKLLCAQYAAAQVPRQDLMCHTNGCVPQKNDASAPVSQEAGVDRLSECGEQASC